MAADQELPGLAAQAGLVDPMAAQAPQQSAKKKEGTPEERAARTDTDTTRTAKARVKAAKAGEVS